MGIIHNEKQSLALYREELLEHLKHDAYFPEKTILSSGRTSDYYIDARRVTLSAKGVNLCARIILEAIKDDGVDAVGGPTLGADPLLGAISVLSLQAGRPINTFIIRKAPKPHGKQQQIEGPLLLAHSKVILLDDVATTGAALVQSLEVLHKMSIHPTKAICIVNRNEGAKEALAAKGCTLISIFDISEIHSPH